MKNKIIHFCWFGKQSKPSLVNACFESWQKYLPEYEFKEWNEDNTVLDCSYAKKAYSLQKWAFLSDYIRLKVLHEFGGLYLDTDMMFIRSLPDDIQDQFFIGEQMDGQLNAAIIGCSAGNSFIKKCLDVYRSMDFDEQRLMSMAIPKIITEQYERFADKDQVTIYDYEYFYPYKFEDSLNGVDYNKSITPKTIAVHLWNASWFSEKEMAGFALEQKHYFKAVLYMMKYYLKNPRYTLQLPSLIYRYLTRKK